MYGVGSCEVVRPISKAALESLSACNCSCNRPTCKHHMLTSAQQRVEVELDAENPHNLRRLTHKQLTKLSEGLVFYILLESNTSVMQCLLSPFQTSLQNCIALHLIERTGSGKHEGNTRRVRDPTQESKCFQRARTQKRAQNIAKRLTSLAIFCCRSVRVTSNRCMASLQKRIIHTCRYNLKKHISIKNFCSSKSYKPVCSFSLR